MLRGAEGSQHPAKAKRRLPSPAQTVRVLFAAGELGQTMSRHYATQGAALQRTGRPVGGTDLWIASNALAESATLVTNNTKKFSRIQGLTLDNGVS
jgi:tRNA(fMet)-specific endonuclease VapC